MEPLTELQIADSRFLGFCWRIINSAQALEWQSKLKSQHPHAAHIPMIWKLDGSQGYDEDNEPPNTVGVDCMPFLVTGTAVVIVRYFGSQLLGVTCGRLPQCYQSVTRLTMQRFLQGDTPMIWEIPTPTSNVYGMAAGDCELILNIVKDPDGSLLLDQVRKELNFGGFRGAAGEVLPRLQNLQADMSENIIPVYRYPGNYSGQEWTTFDWAPTSLQIKQSVEKALQPLVNQTMNHCVTNYYRDGTDFIAHHSDKDLDLNRDGVIVSVSLGDERVLELRRRQEPKDVTRIILPHCSMLVLGPKTNQLFSHSILPKEASTKSRISLTLREVKTFVDLTTGQLFGQGAQAKSLAEIRQRYMMENIGWFGGFCALSAWLVGMNTRRSVSIVQSTMLSGVFAAGLFSIRHWSHRQYQQREEQAAREFFSKTSMSGTKY